MYEYLEDNLFTISDRPIFADIYSNVDDFITDYKSIGKDALNYPNVAESDNNIKTLYYLLYAKYGNSVIINFDVTQFKFKLWSTVFMYGPTWEKRLTVQNLIRNLTDNDILEGGAQINNYAQATGSDATNTKNTKDLDGVNSQNRTMIQRDKLTAYNNLVALLETDVTKEFIDKFGNLFDPFAQHRATILYKED